MRRFLSLFVVVFLYSAMARGQAPPTADTYVASSSPNTNYGSSTILALQPNVYTFISFNLSGIPTTATVQKAVLRLFVSAPSVPATGTFNVYQINTSWAEKTLTWNNKPALGSVVGNPVSLGSSSYQNFVEIDITSLVQQWVNGTLANNGIALVTTTTGASYSFDSKEATTYSHQPELAIAIPGAQGAQGPQGATGLTGPQGPQGATGATGSQGPQGTQGPIGLTGPQGTQGTAGTTGANGQGFTFQNAFSNSTNYNAYDVVTYNGSTYEATVAIAAGGNTPDLNPNWALMAQQGAQGQAGATGAQGPQGPIGLQGPQGSQGAQGPIGLTGPQGPQGTQGPIGLTGPQGTQGNPGAAGANGQGFTFQNAFNNSTNYNAYDVVTYNGSTYEATIAIVAGGNPPNLNPNWALMAQQGAQGQAGATGGQGPQGPIGLQGPQGSQGAQGPIGLTGPQGPQGTQGPIGLTGPQGTQGNPGTTGANGQGFTFQNAFSNSTNYNAYDVVTYNGSTYEATVAIVAGGNTPDLNPNWALMAQQGAQGQAGATGGQGPQGPIGLQGPQGPQGVSGNLIPGSPYYIQNGTGIQSGTSFAIDGSGTVGGALQGSTINAANSSNNQPYSIAGNPVFGIGSPADKNVFLGSNTGSNDIEGTGIGNLFAGNGAGQSNTTGSNNVFAGFQAGNVNIAGTANVFIGHNAGFYSTGSNNAFYGNQAGDNNTTGNSNLYLTNEGCTYPCTESNTIRIGTQGSGSGQQNVIYVAGIAGATTNSGLPVFIDSSGKLGTAGGSLGGVTSFNGRNGPVVPQSGDYTAAQITGALQSANNLADISSAAAARANLGVPSSASLTTNILLKANGASSIANSSVTDDGTTVTVPNSGGLNVSTGSLTLGSNTPLAIFGTGTHQVTGAWAAVSGANSFVASLGQGGIRVGANCLLAIVPGISSTEGCLPTSISSTFSLSSSGQLSTTAAQLIALWSSGTCSGFLRSDGTCGSTTGGLADPGANGVIKRTALNATAVASAADVVALWASGSCTGFLKNDGTCASSTGGLGDPGANGFLYRTALNTTSAVTPSGSKCYVYGGTGGQGCDTPPSGGLTDPGSNGIVYRTGLNTTSAITPVGAKCYTYEGSGGTGCDSGGSGTGFNNLVGTGYQDVTLIAAPANPAPGNARLYVDSTTMQATCLTSSGTRCLSPGAPFYTTTATATLSTSTANLIGPVMMTTPSADGEYKFSWELSQTNTSLACSPAGSLIVLLAYASPDFGTVNGVSGMLAEGAAGGNVILTMPMAAGAASQNTSWRSISQEFRAKAGTAITYTVKQSVASASCTTFPTIIIRPALYGPLGY